MKKILALSIAAALSLSLAACASSADSETEKPTGTQGTQATKPTTQATTQTTVPPTTTPVFREITLVDTDDVTVKITGIEEDAIFGYTLKVFIENKTDKELMFTVENVSVNGFMCDPFWASTVDAGMKANEEISFSDKEFEKNNIEAVEKIQLTLRAYDNDDWTADDIVNETLTITP